MPIQVQCCGLLIMFILLHFYRSQKTIKLNTERAFWRSFVVTLICIAFDILSCAVISNRDILPDLSVKFISKTYLVTLVFEAFFALHYICTDIYHNKTVYKKIMIKYINQNRTKQYVCISRLNKIRKRMKALLNKSSEKHTMLGMKDASFRSNPLQQSGFNVVPLFICVSLFFQCNKEKNPE